MAEKNKLFMEKLHHLLHEHKRLLRSGSDYSFSYLTVTSGWFCKCYIFTFTLYLLLYIHLVFYLFAIYHWLLYPLSPPASLAPAIWRRKWSLCEWLLLIIKWVCKVWVYKTRKKCRMYDTVLNNSNTPSLCSFLVR